MNHEIARDIFYQIQGEAGARHDYEDFLAMHNDKLEPIDIQTIQEIQADEANHMIRLQAMARKYDNAISATHDGMRKAIDQITLGTTYKTMQPKGPDITTNIH